MQCNYSAARQLGAERVTERGGRGEQTGQTSGVNSANFGGVKSNQLLGSREL
jgi:hypothetical protein